MELFNLEGKVVIVTGAGRGIGREIALGFANAGCRLVICSRTISELEALAKEIESLGSRAHIVRCDITQPDDVDRVVQEAIDQFGKIDILINNAGITKKHPAEEFPLEDWNQIIQVNLTGVFLFTQKVGNIMLEQGSGSIINLSSIASQSALTGSLAYCVSKGGVDMLTKTFAMEWATRGVRVNAIAPAYIETLLVQEIKDHRPKFVEDILHRTPMNRMGDPKEIVGTAIYLASDAATYVTGETIFVDGGWMAAGL